MKGKLIRPCRRLVCFLIIAIMPVIGMGGPTVWAVSGHDTRSPNTLPGSAARIAISNTTGMPGEEVGVAVSLPGNPGIAGFSLRIGFDREMLTPLSVTKDGSLEGGVFATNVDTPGGGPASDVPASGDGALEDIVDAKGGNGLGSILNAQGGDVLGYDVGAMGRELYGSIMDAVVGDLFDYALETVSGDMREPNLDTSNKRASDFNKDVSAEGLVDSILNTLDISPVDSIMKVPGVGSADSSEAIPSTDGIDPGSGDTEDFPASQYVTVVWASLNDTVTEELFTIRFRVNDNATEGKTPVSVSMAELKNAELEDAPFSANDGFVDIMPSFIRGDVNGDGLVNISDLILLSQYLAEVQDEALHDLEIQYGDVNLDGHISVVDLIILTQRLMDIPE